MRLKSLTREEAAARITAETNPFQTPFWAAVKASAGWKDYWFLPYDDAEGKAPLLVLLRRLAGPFALAYVPYPHGWATGADSGEPHRLADLSRELLGALPLGTLFVRYDLAASQDGPEPPRPLRKAPMDIQPPSTTILDITADEEALLAGMKSKTRYNIRLAAKKGVEVAEEGLDSLPAWYALYRETAERDKIALHSESYYRRISELAAEDPSVDVRLYMALHEGDALAGIITLFCGEHAVYLYGASSNHKRNLMPAYALQWQAIRDAKAAGCRSYDFFGIPPEGEDEDHPMHGLYRFKVGFGGALLHRQGCWDYPFSHLFYQLYRAAEKARYWYYKVWRKR